MDSIQIDEIRQFNNGCTNDVTHFFRIKGAPCVQ